MKLELGGKNEREGGIRACSIVYSHIRGSAHSHSRLNGCCEFRDVEKQEGKRRKGKAAHLCVIDSSSNQFRIDSIHRLTIIEQDLVVAILQKERRERGSVYGIPSKQTPFLSLSLSRLTFVSQ